MFELKGPFFGDASNGNPDNGIFENIRTPTSAVTTIERQEINPTKTAAFLLKIRAERIEQVRDTIPDIDDISWHILLDLMVSMETGKPVTPDDLATSLNVTTSVMLRYVDYLSSSGLIEKNIAANNEERVLLKLTDSGDDLASSALRSIGHDLVNF